MSELIMCETAPATVAMNAASEDGAHRGGGRREGRRKPRYTQAVVSTRFCAPQPSLRTTYFIAADSADSVTQRRFYSQICDRRGGECGLRVLSVY
ncbi:hypothetical protein ACFQ4Q_07705 [Lysobacter gummosus]|uniref:hypothetical protein n=1 Tax=Lysobacter gummosus TaxID=262324 RepID=UPI00362FDCF1